LKALDVHSPAKKVPNENENAKAWIATTWEQIPFPYPSLFRKLPESKPRIVANCRLGKSAAGRCAGFFPGAFF